MILSVPGCNLGRFPIPSSHGPIYSAPGGTDIHRSCALSRPLYTDLIAAHGPWILARVRVEAVRMGRLDLIEDLHQEALTELWIADNTYNPSRASWRTWASVVIRRRCQAYLGTEHTQTRVVRRVVGRMQGGVGGEPVDAPSVGAGDRARLVVVLEELTEDQRKVLAARVEGRTLADIAEDRGTSRQSVARLEQRARRRLERLMGEGLGRSAQKGGERTHGDHRQTERSTTTDGTNNTDPGASSHPRIGPEAPST
ncbi:MAG: sigma-70 family RNA polymerase sigma factor [Myxococcota bacterium]